MNRRSQDYFRNTDKKRRERNALKKAMGGRPEPRKQIKVVSTGNKKKRRERSDMQAAPPGQIPLPRRGSHIKKWL